jgi:acetyl-CoA carboxylase alpha subunit
MNDKVISISECTEIAFKLENVSKAELMNRLEDKLSEFETTQIFEKIRIHGHVSVARKPDSEKAKKLLNPIVREVLNDIARECVKSQSLEEYFLKSLRLAQAQNQD